MTLRIQMSLATHMKNHQEQLRKAVRAYKKGKATSYEALEHKIQVVPKKYVMVASAAKLSSATTASRAEDDDAGPGDQACIHATVGTLRRCAHAGKGFSYVK